MRIRKILLRLLGLETLVRALLKLVAYKLLNFKAVFRKKLRAWALRGAMWLLLIGLFFNALFFGLGALALYLNVWLSSAHQGFLLVSVGCVALLVMILLLRQIRR